MQSELKERIIVLASRLHRGLGLPGDVKPVVHTDIPVGHELDKATAMVMTGFVLFGMMWPTVYKELGLKNCLWTAYDKLAEEYKVELKCA